MKNKTPHQKKEGVRLSSYQRLKQRHKEEIQELTEDIVTLVEEKDFLKVTEVKVKWLIKIDMMNNIWFCNITP